LSVDARAALEWYSVAALKVMLRWRGHHGRDPRTKAECIAELRDRLTDPELTKRAIASCDDVTRDALALLRRKGGAMPAAAMRGQIATWHPDLPGDVIQRVPSELVRRALAFWHMPAARYSGTTVHDILRPAGDNPQAALIISDPEILDLVSLPPTLGQIPLIPRGEADWQESPLQSVQQVVSFLRAIETRSPRVLRTGVIGTRDRTALARLAGFEGTDSARLDSAAPGVADGGGSPINFLHHALAGAGVLRVTEDGHLQTTSAVASFVGASPVTQARRLLDAWLSTGESILFELNHLHCDRRSNAPTVVPSLPETRLAYQRLVDLIRRLAQPGHWYSFADLSNVARHEDVEFLVSWRDPSPYDWRPYDANRDSYVATAYLGITLEDSRGRPRTLTMGADWELVEGAFIRAVVRGPLSWLGLVGTGMAPDGQDGFFLTRLGASVLGLEGELDLASAEDGSSRRDSLVVQPNFDIIVYEPDTRPQLLFQVDRFADRMSVDRLAVYHLTRESFCRGLQLGLTVDDIVALLESAARSELPQNVLFTMRDWARQFERIVLHRHGWLLEAPDAATLESWLADPVVAANVDHLISPTLAIVRDSVALNDRLGFLGIDLRVVDAESPILTHAKAISATTISLAEIDANLYLSTTLSAIADLSKGDNGAALVRISEESIRRGVASELGADQIVDLLGQLLNRPLPAGMLTRVRGWAGAYQPVGIGTVAYVETTDSDTMNDLQSDRELSEGFIAMLSPTAAIIRLESVERFRQSLAARGIVSTSLGRSPRGWAGD
jgi:hypothetical protein